MTTMAQQLQVFPIEGDRRVIDVLWGQFDPVVDFFTRFSTDLAKEELGLRICLAALAPGPAVVEGSCPGLSH